MKITSIVVATAALMLCPDGIVAMGPSIPNPRPAGKPAKLESFKWADPFSSRKMKRFAPSCSTEKSFSAKEFLLDDLSEKPPLGLAPWSEALKKIFKGRAYPGSWDGIDPHGYDRNLLMMEYSDVPIKVRQWIEHEERSDGEGKGLFAVYSKPQDDGDEIRNVVKFPTEGMAEGLRPLDKKRIVLFAPGALYDILPLWVAESSSCEGKLSLICFPPKDLKIRSLTKS
jgi:hypothetical protein